MPFFNERNGLRKEYSGHEEASPELRRRLSTVANVYSGTAADCKKNVALNTPYPTVVMAVTQGDYGDVFTAVEIHIAGAIRGRYPSSEPGLAVFHDYSEAFRLSGSVYGLSDAGQVVLRVDKDVAEQIDTTEEILEQSPKLHEAYSKGLRGLLSREAPPEDAVKDFSIVLDGYLKELTGKTYGDAVKKLNADGVIGAHHKTILEQLHRYRSDSFGTTHAGNEEKPKEIDALWYLRTVMAVINYIDQKKGTNKK